MTHVHVLTQKIASMLRVWCKTTFASKICTRIKRLKCHFRNVDVTGSNTSISADEWYQYFKTLFEQCADNQYIEDDESGICQRSDYVTGVMDRLWASKLECELYKIAHL